MDTVRNKLARLRDAMRDAGLTAYFVPSGDPHQSEYVPECWNRRAWLSGFAGSAGDVLVTSKQAGLWTDGRYHLQAADDVKGTGISLFRAGEPGVPSVEQHLSATLGPDDVLGVDPRVVTEVRARRLSAAAEAAGAQFELVDGNLVDAVWTDQPAMPKQPISVWPDVFAGETVRQKLRRLRKAMAERGVQAHLVTALDAIAWLFNLRGSDVEYNPVAIAYAVVTLEEAELFIDARKVPPAARAVLERTVRIRPYGHIERACRALARSQTSVWIDPESANLWCIEALGGSVKVRAPSPIGRMKAKKNAVELAGMRAAHHRDGVAMVRFLRWLAGAVPEGAQTEMSAAVALEAFRAEGAHFQGLSFPTIAGYGHHGAIIHYRVDESSDVPLRRTGLFLVDSGAQYLDGTTDITRTVLLGERATRVQKDRFTRVLKGHIALATARFPAGSSGARLDTLARVALWQAGLDYGHGTGHGVGAYLNVHEGPQAISFGRGLSEPLEPGNIQSNEPGYYEPGKFGIRIENLIEVVEDSGLSRNGRSFLRFETLTLCPIDTRLVEPALLTSDECSWLNRYHARVLRELGPSLEREDRSWLRRVCARI